MQANWTPEQKAAFAEIVRREYASFVRYLWDVIEPGTPLVDNWHIDVICKHLEQVARGEIKDLVICVPPGTMKSTLVSVMWDPWIWLTTPSERTITASYNDSLSIRDNVKARRIIQSDKYQELVQILHQLDPEKHALWALSKDQNQKVYYDNTEGGLREVVTVAGGATGKRGDKTIVDDPHKILDILHASPQRQIELVGEVCDWYLNVFNSRLNDIATGKRVLIMQRIHQMDLAGIVLAIPSFHALVLPMEYDPAIGDEDDPRTVEGELLFPAKFSQAGIQKFKEGAEAMLPEQYAAQYGQSPIPAKGGLIQKEWCTQRYPWRPDWRSNTALPKFKRLVLSWDTANKAKQLNDPSVGLLWGQCERNDVYLLHIWKNRMLYADLEPAVEAHIAETRPDITLIEDAASGSQLLSKLDRAGYKVLACVPNENKHVRMSTQTPWFRTNKMWFPSQDCPGILDYFKELWLFPQSPHDDQVDATSQVLKYFDEFKEEVFAHILAGNGVFVDAEGVVSPLGAEEEDAAYLLGLRQAMGLLMPGDHAKYRQAPQQVEEEDSSGVLIGD